MRYTRRRAAARAERLPAALVEQRAQRLGLRERDAHEEAADRLGITGRIEAAGGIVLEGVCFYNMHAREIGDANGWRRLMSNSAKIVNILGGYGYEPVLAPMERCVESACNGRIMR